MDVIHAKAITAALFGIPGAFALLAPSAARRMAKVFPDNAVAGRILSAAALLWAAALIYYTPLDFLAKFRVAITVFLIVAVPLSWAWTPTLLAARSLGGLWCLIPAPVLVAVRFAPGSGRLVTVSLMYVMAVAGMFSTFSPYLLRDALFKFSDSSNTMARVIGLLLLVAGTAAAAA